MSKLKIEDIREEVEKQGWTLVSEKYTNLDTPMDFLCPEGHKIYQPWKKMRQGLSCPICSKQKNSLKDTEIQPKSRGVQRVLGIDQATKTTGYSIFDNGKLIKYGTFSTSEENEIARCASVKSWMLSMIENWRIDKVGIEGIQFQSESSGKPISVTVFQTLAHLQGILLEACYELNIPYEVVPTNTWRHTCGVKGRSRADKKRSMQAIVQTKYHVDVSDDESDAIGIGWHTSNRLKKNTDITSWEN